MARRRWLSLPLVALALLLLAALPPPPPDELALLRGLTAFKAGEYEEAADFLRVPALHGDSRAVGWATQALLHDGDPAGAARLRERLGDTVAAAALTRVFLRPAGPDGFYYSLVGMVAGDAPGRGAFNNPTGVCLEAAGSLLVAALGSGEVKRFAADGAFLGSLYRGRPHQVAVDAGGNIYLTDFGAHVVVKLDAAGNELMRFGGRGRDPGKFLGPEGLAIDRGGNIYVVDNGNHRVQKFAADGHFLMQFGRYGRGDGQMRGPVALALLPDEIQVLDNGNRRVARFDYSGNWLAAYGQNDAGSPRGLAYDDETVFVADADGKVLAYTADGERLGVLVDADGKRIGGRSPFALGQRDGVLAIADYAGASCRAYRLGRSATGRNLAVLAVSRVMTEYFPSLVQRLVVWTAAGEPLTGLTARAVRVREGNDIMRPVLLTPREELFHAWRVQLICLTARDPEPAAFARSLWRVLPAGAWAQVWGRATAEPPAWVTTGTELLVQAQRATGGPARPLAELLDDALRAVREESANRAIVVMADRWTDDAALDRVLTRARLNRVPVYLVHRTGAGSAHPGVISLAYPAYQPHLLAQRMRAWRSGEYFLTYESPAQGLPHGTWRPVSITVDHLGRQAEFAGGYALP